MGESIGIDSLLGGWAMPKAYSGEMRERVIAEVESGASRREAAEEFWMREQGMFDPARLVFVDETAANTKMVRLSGRCPRGERLIGRVPQGHWKTITFVAALRR